MVIGHKNPDTDSICSAIAYAHYKQQVLGVPAIPYRAGNLNPQTSFVLSHFGVPHPELLTTIHPKLSDIMIQGKDLLALKEEDPLGPAQEIIVQRRFAFLPVVNEGGKYAGKISALRLAGLVHDLTQLCGHENVTIHFAPFQKAISGRVVAGAPPALFTGQLWIPGLSDVPIKRKKPLLVVLNSSRESDLIEVMERGAGVVILCGRETIGPKLQARLRRRDVCVLATPQDVLSVTVHLCLAMPIRNFVERQHPTFKPYDLVRQVQKEIAKYNEGGFIVVDDDGYTCGVITRLSFLNQSRFRVALVDHNELSQAVDGIEEASVEEVIDHHRLGYRSTDGPITFINKVVGSTATIISELYRNCDSVPPPSIAGLLLSAILSDTVILKSPTTTPLDREMARWLAEKAGVELQAHGGKMFSAGCALEGVNPRQIVHQDLKVYQEGNWKFSVSQMETVGFDGFQQIRAALTEELARASEKAECHFSCLMVTDITCGTSLLLCIGEGKIIDAIAYPRLAENLFEMNGVLSRKKQMVPYLLDLLRRL